MRKSTKIEIGAENMTVAVVGLGLMGSSIATNFLIAGHRVIGLTPLPKELEDANRRIEHHLIACEELDIVRDRNINYWERMHISDDYAHLQQCDLVLECVVEDLNIKSEVIKRIEKNVSDQCIIASNTSAIPITTLQEKARIPGRFLGLHWAEPAYGSRFLEIICGAHTDIKYAERTQHWGTLWGKEPILVKKDIRGFVTNRLMYAVYREGLYLLEQEAADLEALDKAFRYDTGSWIAMMGIFQRMDYLGIAHYSTLAKHTFKRLSNATHVPQVMKDLVQEKGRGIHDQKGLYPYSRQEALDWKVAFEKFSREIYQLLLKRDEIISGTDQEQEPESTFKQILIVGDDKLSCSLSVCLARSADAVTWYTSSVKSGLDRLHLHQQDLATNMWPAVASISVIDQWTDIESPQLAFISNQIPTKEIKQFIHKLEQSGSSELIIAIGTRGIPLCEFQSGSSNPENIIGVNWSEPAHTTYFMEIVANKTTNATISELLREAGATSWNKDPYLISGELGIQEKMMCALIREALYLVKNEYASPFDIDRACRNDAGTYLPFSGNFRYMDLMGTYLYGVVMEHLNKELSTDNTVADILQKMVADGQIGLEVQKGFYSYKKEDAHTIDQKMRTFGFAIRQLMAKYMEL